ncbi:g3345 [Coccomyxa elongata]
MKTFMKGVCSVLIMLVTLRLSACATTSFNITKTAGAPVLGPFQGNSVSGGLQTPFSITSAGGGPGSVLGKPSFSPITIAAPHSDSDLTLIQALVTGETLEQVDIGFYGAANDQIYRKITLGKALITSYKSTTDGDGPVTLFTLLFSRHVVSAELTKTLELAVGLPHSPASGEQLA